MAGATVLRFDEIPWNDPKRPSSAPAALVREARASGARWKQLVTGQSGFFLNRSELPAGYSIPPHSHTHDELLYLLRGDCTLSDGTRAGAGDAIVIHAGHAYGFTCGAQGMEFLTIRAGDAGFESRG